MPARCHRVYNHEKQRPKQTIDFLTPIISISLEESESAPASSGALACNGLVDEDDNELEEESALLWRVRGPLRLDLKEGSDDDNEESEDGDGSGFGTKLLGLGKKAAEDDDVGSGLGSTFGIKCLF